MDTFDGKVDVAKPRFLRRCLPIVEITLARAFPGYARRMIATGLDSLRAPLLVPCEAADFQATPARPTLAQITRCAC